MSERPFARPSLGRVCLAGLSVLLWGCSSSEDGSPGEPRSPGGSICEVLAATPPAATPGVTYYVDPSGDDGSAGTDSQPFGTIQHAADLAAPGDRVVVRPGTYRELVTISTSGQPGMPIVFEGTRSEGGERLSVVDPSEPITSWEPAPEVAAGVFKTTAVPFEPFCMTLDHKDIPRLGHVDPTSGSYHPEYDAFIFLAKPPDDRVITQYLEAEVNYWDGIEALYAHQNGITYLRFRDGDDPRSLNISAAPAGAAFLLDGASHITVRGFSIRGAQYGVRVAGDTATDNVVEDNFIINGQRRIFITDGAQNTHVRLNEARMNRLGPYAPGAWGAGTAGRDATPYENAVKEHIYNTYKHEVGRGTSSGVDDTGVLVTGAGSGNEIYCNTIYETLINISTSDTSDVRIYANTLYSASSVGLVVSADLIDAEYFDNTLYDINIPIRVHQLESYRRVYIYRNRIWNLLNFAQGTYWHWTDGSPEPQPHPEVWFYHNTFAASGIALSFSSFLGEQYGLPESRFVNNVFSASRLWSNPPDNLPPIDYNWIGGTQREADAPLLGPNNVVEPDAALWPGDSLPDFELPTECAARQAGIDLSTTFTIDGQTYDGLPGMEPGYFDGPRPNMGAIP